MVDGTPPGRPQPDALVHPEIVRANPSRQGPFVDHAKLVAIGAASIPQPSAPADQPAAVAKQEPQPPQAPAAAGGTPGR